MAGIGFSLQRMAEGRSLSGQAGAYVYSVFLVAGPWIFMAMAIAGMSTLACPDNQCAPVQVFRSIAIYNFCFSLLIAGAISLPITRYVSDQIYAKQDGYILGAFVFALALFGVLALVLVLPFYVFLGDLSAAHRWAAFQNVLLAGAAWLIVPFLGTLKDYRGVSLAFMAGAGVMLAVVAVNREAPQQSLVMLNAFNLGLGVINGGLAFCVVREFGCNVEIDRALFHVFTRYWELAAIGTAHYVGIWIDKIIMWQAASSGTLTIAGVFRTMPDYDAVMFWAQLTTIPILAVFFVHVEPNFYRLYRRFYGSFGRHSSKREIEERMAALTSFVVRNVIGIFSAMVVVTAAAMVFSFIAIEGVGLRANQMGMLRAALFGVGFHTSALFCQIFLLYFDLRRYALTIAVLYAALNAALTLALLPLGFAYYGYGQMLAAALTFFTAFAILVRELPWLHYHAFVTNNRSVGDAQNDSPARGKAVRE
jgi:uncharacterized membrane protein